MDNITYPAPHEQTASTVVDGQAVIVLADTAQVTILNEIGTRIWQLSDGTHSVETILQQIVAEFEVSEDVARADVDSFLKELVEKQALILMDQPHSIP